jgi:hypothetical protein
MVHPLSPFQGSRFSLSGTPMVAIAFAVTSGASQ